MRSFAGGVALVFAFASAAIGAAIDACVKDNNVNATIKLFKLFLFMF